MRYSADQHQKAAVLLRVKARHPETKTEQRQPLLEMARDHQALAKEADKRKS